MRYCTIGDTKLEISVLGLGTWPMGGGEPGMRWGNRDDTLALRAIEHAVEQGVNWLDTAPVYGLGHAEQLVGRVLGSLSQHDRPYIFTKCGLTIPENGEARVDLSASTIRAQCDDSLDKLGIERIDLLQIHWPGDDEEELEHAGDCLESLKKEGKIREAGVCNMSSAQMEAFMRRGRLAALQSPLSLVRRDALADFTWCQSHGITGLAYSPLQCGLLSGHFSPKHLSQDDWRGQDAAVRWDHQYEFHEPRLGRNRKLASRLAEIAEGLGTSPSAVAIAWTLSWPGVSGTIVGARTPEQVDEWISAGNEALRSSTLQALAEAIAETGAGSGPNDPLQALTN